MGLTGKNRTDERLTISAEQHRVAGLTDPNLIDHPEERIEPVRDLDRTDHDALVVVQDGHRHIDRLVRSPKGTPTPGRESAQIDLFTASVLNRLPPRLIPKEIVIWFRRRRNKRSIAIRDEDPDHLISISHFRFQEKS